MTDEIPDDVVERALDEFDADWRLGSSTLPDAMRAALRVAMEWEREQCARVVEKWAETTSPAEEAEAVSLAHAIRSRKD